MEWIESVTPLVNNRFRHITSVSVQIYKLEGSSWREMTKDFVLLHMYYDQEDREAKLIAIDGIKLIIRGFVLSSNLQLIRSTKKFLHFIGYKQRRSEMYGFGFYQVSEVEQFLRLFSFVYRILHLSSRTVAQNESGLNKRHLSISSTKSQSSYPLPLPTASIQMHLLAPKKDTTAIPCIFLEDSLPQEETSQTDVNVQHIEKGLQEMSFTPHAFVRTPNLSLIPPLSTQIFGDASSNFHCVNSTKFDLSKETAESVEQKQYQLWNVPPWNALLEQETYNNPANFTSPWNPLFNQ